MWPVQLWSECVISFHPKFKFMRPHAEQGLCCLFPTRQLVQGRAASTFLCTSTCTNGAHPASWKHTGQQDLNQASLASGLSRQGRGSWPHRAGKGQ